MIHLYITKSCNWCCTTVTIC